jgi:predicted aminopeptidase
VDCAAAGIRERSSRVTAVKADERALDVEDIQLRRQRAEDPLQTKWCICLRTEQLDGQYKIAFFQLHTRFRKGLACKRLQVR